MKTLVLLALTFVAAPVIADDTPPVHPLTLAPGAWLHVDGDSTFHRFSLKTEKLQVHAESAVAADLATAVEGGGVKTLIVEVPVASLTSGESGLDDNMKKALSADTHPAIVFQMDSYRAKKAGNGFDLTLHGRLKIAGNERTVDIPVRGEPTANGFRFTGSYPVLMSDYQVKAPVFGGIMRTDNKVTIGFAIELRQ